MVETKIMEIDVDRIEPNPWNPNEMSERVFEHLKKEFKRVGYLQPILVRPYKNKYQIIDGEHRWRVAKEVGLKRIKCVVIDVNDTLAKTITLNMNKIKGGNNLEKLNAVIEDLKTVYDLDELSEILDMDKEEMEIFKEAVEFEESEEEETKPRRKYVICPKCGEKIYLDKVKVEKE